MATTSEHEKALAEPFPAEVVALPAAPGLDELDLANAAVIVGELRRARQLLAAMLRRLERPCGGSGPRSVADHAIVAPSKSARRSVAPARTR